MIIITMATWFYQRPYMYGLWFYLMGFAVRVRSAGQNYGPTCHQRDRADVTEFVTLVRLSSLGQHVGVLALTGYKRRKSALTAGPIVLLGVGNVFDYAHVFGRGGKLLPFIW